MPKGTNRQSNAQDKALETISKVGTIEADPEEESLSQSATVVNHPANEQVEEQPKPRKKTQAVEPQQDQEVSKKKGQTEDFFDYLQRVTPEEWSNSQTSGLYIYKRSPKGNVRITDEPLHCPITLQELREEYLPVHGDGTYRLQFTTGLKHLSNCGENVTFDASGNSLSNTPTGFLRAGSVQDPNLGVPEVMAATSRMLEHGARASVDVVKQNQIENNKSIDVAGIITAIAALNNHKDGDSALVKMLEAQKAEADKRADREKSDADARVLRETTAANERQARDQQFFQMIMKQNEDRAADKDKFFEILLKEKDKKEDSFGMGDVLKELFKAFAQERLEGGGDQMLPGWAGVLQTIVPKVAEAIPTILAARNGASPQQIQQIQEQQRIAAETQHGPNGGLRQQNPAEPKLLTTEDELNGFIDRLGTYLTGKIQQGRPADPAYMIQVLDEEFLLVANLLENNTKEVIISAIQSAPLGGQLLQIPTAPAFLEELINKLKQPEEEEEQEPELVGVIPQQPQTKRKKAAH